jgi:thioredoxin reductase (NADPH)
LLGLHATSKGRGQILDVLIVGGGPAGLAAALYLARFRRRLLLVDAGESRAEWIPLSRNLAGFPGGIAGAELLERIRHQAKTYRSPILRGCVSSISRERDGSFRVVIGTDAARTRTVLLATGVVDKIPSIPEARSAVKRGLLRLCPVCDGYEVIDQKLAVVGHSGSAVREALFMSTYSQDLTLLTLGQPLPDEQRDQLRQANIRVESRKLVTLASDGGKVHARLGDGTDQSFDAVYSALGCRPRSDLGRRLGCRLASDGRLVVTEHQETSQPNVWAAGDVVLGLNQIGVAIGEAAIAATAIHNALARRD